MRVHVISDMEGVSGIVKAEQTSGGAPLYEEGRKLYTEEINAAVRGAKAAGATEIVVMDCHGAGKEFSFNSLVPELLDPACDWVVQDEWTEYTAFLESKKLDRERRDLRDRQHQLGPDRAATVEVVGRRRQAALKLGEVTAGTERRSLARQHD